jgi:hypothetical protein
MAEFRSFGGLREYASLQLSVRQLFDHECHLNRREKLKKNDSAALTKWCQPAT